MKLSTYLLSTCVVLLLGFTHQPIIYAQNQGEMNLQSFHDFEVADAKLNKAYKQLMGKLDKPAQAKLKAAQLAWITFRDAQAALEADLDGRGGTIAPTLYNVCRTDLTEKRTAELEKLMRDYSN